MTDFIFLASKITADGDCSHEIKRCLLLGRKAITKLDGVLKNTQRHHFADKGLYRQSCGFSSSHEHLWELEHKKGLVPKNWCFWIVVLEKTLESPLNSKEIKAVNSKGYQPWIFIGRTDAEAEAPMLWPLEPYSLENLLILGKTRGKRRKGQQRMRPLDSITDSMDMNLSKLQEIVEEKGSWCVAVHGAAKNWKQLMNDKYVWRWKVTVDRICRKQEF